MFRRPRFSLAAMLVVTALVGIALVTASRWRVVLVESWIETGSRSTLEGLPAETAAIDFLESRGFKMFSGVPKSKFGQKNIPSPDVQAVVMRGDIHGNGQIFVFFWFDKPRLFKDKERGWGMGLNQYADPPWYLKQESELKIRDLKNAFEELDVWRQSWERYRKPFDETVEMLKAGYFRGKSEDEAYAETAELWK